jgi:hypothetical protein
MNFNNADSSTAPTASVAKTTETAPWSDMEDDVATAETSFTPPPAAPAASVDKPSSQRAEDILAMIRNRQK